MRTEWLRYFYDAARLGSIKASAEIHNISPQGLSKAVRSLEKELGCKLFDRNANSVQLTPRGAQLLPEIGTICDELDKLAKDAACSPLEAAEKSPILVLCSMLAFLDGVNSFLEQALRELPYQVTYMQVETSKMLKDMLARPKGIYEGKIVCGFPLIFEPTREQTSDQILKLMFNGYAHLPLFRYRDGILVSRAHPLAGESEVSRAQILEYPVVSSSQEQLEPLVKYLGKGHVTTAIADIGTRLRMLEDGKTIIFVPPFFRAGGTGDFAFCPLRDGYTVECGFLYDRENLPYEAASAMADSAKSAFAEHEQVGLCKIVD